MTESTAKALHHMSTSKTQGYITAATGHNRHLEMAADLCLSLKEHDPERGFAVVVDRFCAQRAKELPVFDHVFEVDDQPGFVGKLTCGEVSPFDETFFFDADCLAVGSLEELWAHLPGRHFCIGGQYVDADHPGHSANHPIREICRDFEISRYYWAIGPMFYFDGEGREVLAEVKRLYLENLDNKKLWVWDNPVPSDEILFGVVGGRQEFAPFPPVQTLIKQKDLPEWTVGNPPHPMFHCTMGPRLSVLRDLMTQVERRRAEHGLPQGSRRLWVRKALQKKAQQSITKALGLPWRNPFARK